MRRACAIVAAASSRGGSNSGSRPRKRQARRLALTPRDAQRPIAFRRERIDRGVNLGLERGIGLCHGQDDLRRALGDPKTRAVAPDRGLGALAHGIEREKLADSVVIESARAQPKPSKIAWSIASPPSRREASAAASSSSLGVGRRE